MPTPRDYPLAECAAAMRKLVEEEGADVYLKWTCGGCGERVTSGVANTAFELATCEDCGHVTDLRVAGCNYLVHMVIGRKG